MSQQVTMETVAELSGVSISTVSLVLRDKPGINVDTRKRVLEAARQVGYHRKYPSASQRTEGLQNVGLVVKSQGNVSAHANQFYLQVIAGIEAACRKLNVNLLYAAIPVDEDNHPTALPRLFFESHVDGMLLLGAFADEIVIQTVQQKSLPLVLVDAYAPAPIFDSVTTDNLHGAYEAVSYLLQKGHRDIGLIGSLPQTFPSIDDRRAGYRKALSDRRITDTYFGDSYWNVEDAYAAARILLKRHPQITALFASNDSSAIGAMRAAHEAGRQLPDDLSIVGFDDIELARHLVPSLTTMAVDKQSMGRLAVQLLADRIEFPEAALVTALLRPRLIERQSVGVQTAVPGASNVSA